MLTLVSGGGGGGGGGTTELSQLEQPDSAAISNTDMIVSTMQMRLFMKLSSFWGIAAVKITAAAPHTMAINFR